MVRKSSQTANPEALHISLPEELSFQLRYLSLQQRAAAFAIYMKMANEIASLRPPLRHNAK